MFQAFSRGVNYFWIQVCFDRLFPLFPNSDLWQVVPSVNRDSETSYLDLALCFSWMEEWKCSEVIICARVKSKTTSWFNSYCRESSFQPDTVRRFSGIGWYLCPQINQKLEITCISFIHDNVWLLDFPLLFDLVQLDHFLPTFKYC